MEQRDKGIAGELDAFLQSHNCCSVTGEIISGSEALNKIIAEYKSRLFRVKTARSKQKYSNVLTFLQTFGKGDAAQKKRLYSFCSDIVKRDSSPIDTMLVSFHGGDNSSDGSDYSGRFKFNERELDKFIEQSLTQETFADLVISFMNKNGMSPAEVYTNANLSRQDFSRVTTRGKGVTRPTVFSMAIGLQLNWNETKLLMLSAGYAFRSNSMFDLILMFCITNKLYDVEVINELLYERGQKTLATNGNVKVSDKDIK